MAISITINNKTFNIPVAGEDPGWGEDTTAWIREVSNLINSELFGIGDIVESSASIQDGIASPTAITTLSFDPSEVRSAIIEYDIYRVSDEDPTGNIENGMIYVVYDDNAADWLISRDFSGDSQVDLDITPAGQIEYTSVALSGNTNYTGTINFRARAFTK